jgi:hypothetical protein
MTIRRSLPLELELVVVVPALTYIGIFHPCLTAEMDAGHAVNLQRVPSQCPTRKLPSKDIIVDAEARKMDGYGMFRERLPRLS